MSKELLGAASAVALLAGVAAAQDAGPGATPTPAAPTTTPAPAPTTPAATAGEAVRAADMIGRSVQGSDGKPLGKVKDAVVDAQSGKIQKLVIASGGFLGLGAKNVALDFDRVEVRPEGGIVAKDVTQKDVEAMPRYDVAAETRPLDKPPAARRRGARDDRGRRRRGRRGWRGRPAPAAGAAVARRGSPGRDRGAGRGPPGRGECHGGEREGPAGKEKIATGMAEAGKGRVKGGGEAGKGGPGHGADPGKLTEGMAEAGSGTATGVPADAERLERP